MLQPPRYETYVRRPRGQAIRRRGASSAVRPIVLTKHASMKGSSESVAQTGERPILAGTCPVEALAKTSQRPVHASIGQLEVRQLSHRTTCRRVVQSWIKRFTPKTKALAQQRPQRIRGTAASCAGLEAPTAESVSIKVLQHRWIISPSIDSIFKCFVAVARQLGAADNVM